MQREMKAVMQLHFQFDVSISRPDWQLTIHLFDTALQPLPIKRQNLDFHGLELYPYKVIHEV